MPANQSMLVQQINGLALLLYTIYLLIVVFITALLAYKCGVEDERERHVRVYKNSNAVPTKRIPVKHAKVYKTPRHYRQRRR